MPLSALTCFQRWQCELTTSFKTSHLNYHPLKSIPAPMHQNLDPSNYLDRRVLQDNHRPLVLPQDKLGLIPHALLQSRIQNLTRQIDKKRKIVLLRSYLPDWIVVVLMLLMFSLLNQVHGFHREFNINDSSIQFSYADQERVPVPLLVVLTIVIPTILIVLSSQLLLRSSWDTHTGLLGLALSISLSLAITNITKVTVGRPRPDMLARCQPKIGAMNAGLPSFGLSNSSICTADVNDRKFQDGFRSFPSGHSSTAWAGYGFLALYLAGKFHLFNRRGHVIKIWISVAPLFGAALIAISRTMDYRHHWQDVLVGSALGALAAWFSYRFYYPTISSPSSHLPYSPRVPSESSGHDVINPEGSTPSRDSCSGDVENQLMQTDRHTAVNFPAPSHLNRQRHSQAPSIDTNNISLQHFHTSLHDQHITSEKPVESS